MKNIMNKYETLTNRFDPAKFMAIRVDGQIVNNREFVMYKLKTVVFDHKLV